MAEESSQNIVVKRVKKVAGGTHGGAWKIAYADFVTAMMAFFLLMWLLGSTTKGDLQGIADYFNTPLKVALEGGSGSGDSSSVLKGGGTDLTRQAGQVKQGETPPVRRTINLRAAEAELQARELDRLRALKGRVEAAIEANAFLRPYSKQLKVELTADGLRIQIVDEQNRPMFDSGSAVVKDYMREILRELGRLLNDVPNRISLAGHTDAKQYAMGERGYSNWELSADRANASRRELIAGGILEDKMLRVVGLGPAVMLDRNDPNSPINRRISITVLNQQAERRILDEGVSVPSDAMPPAAPAAEPDPATAPAPAASPTAPPAPAPAGRSAP